MYRKITFVLLLVSLFLLAPTQPVFAQSAAAEVGGGHQLPLPWGFGLTLFDQNQPYKIVSLEVPLAGIEIGAADQLEVFNEVTSYHFKFDYWLLPFLDVYLLGGVIDGTTTVKLSNIDLGLPILLNDLQVNYDGYVYGGGATLAVGGEKWFTSLTYDLTRTDLDTTDSTVKAWLLTPRVGLVFEDAVVYIGAMYQQAEETHEGIFEMPYLGEVPFHVVLEQAENWNYMVGMAAGLSKHWVMTLEGSVGDRTSVLAALEYRFGKP